MATQPPPRHTTRTGSLIGFLRRTHARSRIVAPPHLSGSRTDLCEPRSGEGSRTLPYDPSDRARSTNVGTLSARRLLPELARGYGTCAQSLLPKSPAEPLAKTTS